LAHAAVVGDVVAHSATAGAAAADAIAAEEARLKR
jgi:hypothetical protein